MSRVTTALLVFGSHILTLSLSRSPYPMNIMDTTLSPAFKSFPTDMSAASPKRYGFLVHYRFTPNKCILCMASFLLTSIMIEPSNCGVHAIAEVQLCRAYYLVQEHLPSSHVIPARYRNTNSARLLCCGVSSDINSKSISCSTAQSVLPVCLAYLRFSPTGSNCMYCTGMFHAFSLFRCLQVSSTMSLFVAVKLLHFFTDHHLPVLLVYCYFFRST